MFLSKWMFLSFEITLFLSKPPKKRRTLKRTPCNKDFTYFTQNYHLIKDGYKTQQFILPNKTLYKGYSRFPPLSSDERSLILTTAPALTLYRITHGKDDQRIKSISMAPVYTVSSKLLFDKNTNGFSDLRPYFLSKSATNTDLFDSILHLKLFKNKTLILFYSYREAEIYAMATQYWYIYELFNTQPPEKNTFTVKSKYIGETPFVVSIKTNSIDAFDIRAVYDSYQKSLNYNPTFRIIYQINKNAHPVKSFSYVRRAPEDPDYFTGLQEYSDFLRERLKALPLSVSIYKSSLDRAARGYLSALYDYAGGYIEPNIYLVSDNKRAKNIEIRTIYLISFLLQFPDFLELFYGTEPKLASFILYQMLVAAYSTIGTKSRDHHKEAVHSILSDMGLSCYWFKTDTLIQDIYAESGGFLSYNSIVRNSDLQNFHFSGFPRESILKIMFMQLQKTDSIDTTLTHKLFAKRILEMRVLSDFAYTKLRDMSDQYRSQNQVLNDLYDYHLIPHANKISQLHLIESLDFTQRALAIISTKDYSLKLYKNIEALFEALAKYIS